MLSSILTTLGSTIETHEGQADEPRGTGVLDEMSTLRLVLFAEELHCFHSYVDGTPEVGLEHLAGGVLRDSFRFSRDDDSCVVEDDIDAAKRLLRSPERFLDVFLVCDIELHNEELGGGVLGGEVSEHGGLAESRDDLVAVRKCAARHLEAETC